jgi:hypothetical protein
MLDLSQMEHKKHPGSGSVVFYHASVFDEI